MALLALVLVVGGIIYFNSKPEGENMMKDGEAMMEGGDAMEKEGEAMMEEGGDTMMEGGEAMMEKTVTVTLNAQNNSGEKGSAVLSDVDGKTKVTVNINGAPAGIAQPMHIHTGSCPTPGAVLYPLTSLMNGISETVIDVPLSKILSELPLAINVHKSAAEAKIFVSCGDIVSEVEKKN